MAKLFKLSAYVVDPNDEFNKNSLEDCLVYCTQNDLSLRHLKVNGVDIGEWDDGLPINQLNCNLDEFDKYFKHGQWYINPDGYYPYCSECGQEPQGREMTKWCPNCGAKMDERKWKGCVEK